MWHLTADEASSHWQSDTTPFLNTAGWADCQEAIYATASYHIAPESSCSAQFEDFRRASDPQFEGSECVWAGRGHQGLSVQEPWPLCRSPTSLWSLGSTMEPWRLGSAAASASGASSIASMASIASVDSALGTHYREPIDSSHLAEDSSNLSWCSAQLAPELADSARKAWAVELGEIRELERESQGEFGDPLDLEAFVLSESRSSPTELLPFGLLDSPLNSPSSRNESSELKTSKTPKPRQEKRGLPREYHHSRVPKNVNLQEEYESHPGREITTLMIRNIPNRYTQQELIAELEDLGFAGSFNFLYIPLDKGTMSNVGYAFVNFVNTDWANRCILTFQGYRFKRHRKSSGKIAAISTAHLQGLEANLAHYEKSAVNTAKLKHRRPVVMANISTGLNSVA